MQTTSYIVCSVVLSNHKKARLLSIKEELPTHSEKSAMNRFNALVQAGQKAFVGLLENKVFKRYKAKNFNCALVPVR